MSCFKCPERTASQLLCSYCSTACALYLMCISSKQSINHGLREESKDYECRYKNQFCFVPGQRKISTSWISCISGLHLIHKMLFSNVCMRSFSYLSCLQYAISNLQYAYCTCSDILSYFFQCELYTYLLD